MSTVLFQHIRRISLNWYLDLEDDAPNLFSESFRHFILRFLSEKIPVEFLPFTSALNKPLSACAIGSMDSAPDRGRRLLVTTIDRIADSEPQRPWISVPCQDDDLTKGFVDITFEQFSNAINHAAAWLQSVLAPVTGQFDTIGYAGPNDARAFIITVAAVKVGRKILLPSPLAPTNVKLHLLDTTDCKSFVNAKSSLAFRSALEQRPHIQSITAPELQDWITERKAEPYKYEKSWEEARNDPWIIFHTSGTTGLPKPIIYSNVMMTLFDDVDVFSDPRLNTSVLLGRRTFSPVPAYHISGIVTGLQSTVWRRAIKVLGPVLKPPSASLIPHVLQFSGATGFVGTPAIIRELSRQSETLQLLRNMESVLWAGAPLDKATGDMLCHHTRLIAAFGSTETGPYSTLQITDPEDWAYIKFAEGQGIQFERWSDDLFELVINRQEDIRWQQIFLLYPELYKFRTKDLFERHPMKEDLWLYSGRKDDMVLLATGDRLHASNIEQIIMQDATIEWALIAGDGRNRPCLILQFTNASLGSTKESDALISTVWPSVEAANAICFESVKLTKKLTICSDPERPFLLSGKGTILRRETLKLYKHEIDKLYK